MLKTVPIKADFIKLAIKESPYTQREVSRMIGFKHEDTLSGEIAEGIMNRERLKLLCLELHLNYLDCIPDGKAKFLKHKFYQILDKQIELNELMIEFMEDMKNV